MEENERKKQRKKERERYTSSQYSLTHISLVKGGAHKYLEDIQS